MRRPVRLLLVLALLFAAGRSAPAQQPQQRATWTGYEEGARCLAFSPDGKTLVSGGRKYDRDASAHRGELRFWDVAASRERVVLPTHGDAVQALAFSPDGKTLATVAGDSAVGLWDVAAGKQVRALAVRGSGPHILAFSADGKALGWAGDCEVRVWDPATGTERASFRRRVNGYGAAFSSDLKTLASPNYQDVDLWDVATAKERLVLEDHRGEVARLVFSADDRTLIAASTRWDGERYFGEVRLWEPATGREQAAYASPIGFLHALALRPDGKVLALGGSREVRGACELKLLDIATGRELASVALPETKWVSCLAFRPDGRLLAVGVEKDVRLYDVPPPAEQKPER